MRIRTLLAALVALLLLAACVGGCKAKLDKAKIAGLAFDFVMANVVSLLDRGEFNPEGVGQLANDLAVEFVVVYSDEVPEKYRMEVKGFLLSIIPQLLSDYMPGLGPDDGEMRAEAVAMMVERWKLYEAAQ